MTKLMKRFIFLIITFQYVIVFASEVNGENVIPDKNSDSGIYERTVFAAERSDMIRLDTMKKDESIVVMAKAYKDSIVLRIAPPDYAFWQRVQETGFMIKRGTDSINLKVIATLFPVSMNTIETIDFSKDSFALMAAGLLYGNHDRSNLKSGAMNEYRANEQLLNMSLMVSEFSPVASSILGFRYTDKDVVPGETYYYEISNSVYKNAKYNGKVTIKNVPETDRSPHQFRISGEDQKLILKWSKDYNQSKFTYYKIERSEDNKNFSLLTELPLVFVNTDMTKNVPDFTYIDTFNLINKKNYYYRLYGGNSFGEYSTPSVANGKPLDLTAPVPPDLSAVTYDHKSNTFNIEWETDIEKLTNDFAYQQVMVSREEHGQYSALSPKLGFADFHYFYELGSQISEEQEGRYFFRIDCYDENGNQSYSNSETSFVPDLTNPKVPDTLDGYIDTMGFVHLHWPRSSSKDVRGYWLYWANSPDAEFSLVSQDILSDTAYRYYIEEKSLTKSIYYTLRAEDYAYNRSATAPMLKLKRLDMVPPVTPAILNIRTDSMRIKINIMESSSEDVRLYELYRRGSIEKDTTWNILDTIWLKNSFIDGNAEKGVDYQYKIRAIDSIGNISQFSAVKNAVFNISGNDLSVKNVKLQKDNNSGVVISWEFTVPDKLKDEKFNYVIYRSTGMDGVKYFSEVTSDNLFFTDSDSESNVLYNYAVRVKYENGGTGTLSEIKSIIIE